MNPEISKKQSRWHRDKYFLNSLFEREAMKFTAVFWTVPVIVWAFFEIFKFLSGCGGSVSNNELVCNFYTYKYLVFPHIIHIIGSAYLIVSFFVFIPISFLNIILTMKKIRKDPTEMQKIQNYEESLTIPARLYILTILIYIIAACMYLPLT
jgi:hypothetical protein